MDISRFFSILTNGEKIPSNPDPGLRCLLHLRLGYCSEPRLVVVINSNGSPRVAQSDRQTSYRRQ
jgi:hypothetical protein